MPDRADRLAKLRALAETEDYNPNEAAAAQAALERMTGVESVAITPLSRARAMLDEAQTVPDYKELRDFAKGAAEWARARGLGIEAENEAAEVIVRAEREIGRLLPGATVPGRTKAAVPAGNSTFLSDFGLTPKDSHLFQKVASLDEADFEAVVAAARESGKRLAKVDFYRAADKAAGTTPKRTTKWTPPPTDSAFETFRLGAFALLSWYVGEDGKGRATDNGLVRLTNDELAQFAELMKALLVAYNAVREERT